MNEIIKIVSGQKPPKLIAISDQFWRFYHFLQLSEIDAGDKSYKTEIMYFSEEL